MHCLYIIFKNIFLLYKGRENIITKSMFPSPNVMYELMASPISPPPHYSLSPLG